MKKREEVGGKVVRTGAFAAVAVIGGGGSGGW